MRNARTHQEACLGWKRNRVKRNRVSREKDHKSLWLPREVIGEAKAERALEFLSVLEEVEDVGKLTSCFLTVL